VHSQGVIRGQEIVTLSTPPFEGQIDTRMCYFYMFHGLFAILFRDENPYHSFCQKKKKEKERKRKLSFF
jgi:hypothetical protein